MKCASCDKDGTHWLIIKMKRETFCATCYHARVTPPRTRSVSESQMIADLQSVDLGDDAELLELSTGAKIMHWETAIVRSSLRALWIAKGFGRRG